MTRSSCRWVGKFWTHNIFLKNQQKLLLTGVELVTTATSPPGMHNNEVMCKQSTNSDLLPNNEQEKRRAYDMIYLQHPQYMYTSAGSEPLLSASIFTITVHVYNRKYSREKTSADCSLVLPLKDATLPNFMEKLPQIATKP